MYCFLALVAILFHVKVVTQGQPLSPRHVVRASVIGGIDQLQQRSTDARMLSEPGRTSRRLDELEIDLEADDDDEEQGAAFDAQFSDVLLPLHNHHEFQDLLSNLHSSNWADGCRAVLVDVGAKRGTTMQMLFEPEKFENASSLPLLERYFGPASMRSKPSNQSGLCAFGFEANPRFVEEHRMIATGYTGRGWQVQFFTPVVASDHDGAEDFYVEDLLEPDNEGLSVLNTSIRNGSNTGKPRKLELPAARLAELMRTKVAERALSEDEVPGKVLMKIDINDEEFAALPDLLQAGLLCQQTGIDGLLVVNQTRSSNNVDRNFTRSWPELKQAIKMQNGCKEPSELIEIELDWAYMDTPVSLPHGNSTSSEASVIHGDLMV